VAAGARPDITELRHVRTAADKRAAEKKKKSPTAPFVRISEQFKGRCSPAWLKEA